MNKKNRYVPRGGFSTASGLVGAYALAAARKNAKRISALGPTAKKVKKKKKKVAMRRPITKRDIDLTKKGNPPKKVKKLLDAPNHFVRHKTQVESCKVNVNGKVKTATSTEERLVQQAPPTSPTGIVFSLKGVNGGSAGNKPKDTLNGKSLFNVPQLKLPQGSKLTSIVTMGRNALPSRSIATPVDVVMFKSDIGGGYNDGSPDLQKSPAMKNKSIGLNMIHNMLIPLEMPNLAYKRLCSTKKFTQSAVSGVTDAVLEKLYNPNNAAPGSATDNEGGVRVVYCPHMRQSIYTISNIQRYLSLSVKIHICQIKNPELHDVAKNTYINPLEAVNRVWDNLMPNARIPNYPQTTANLDYTVQTLKLKALDVNSGTGNQTAWGMADTMFEKMIGSWHVNTTYPSTLRSSPTFEQTFNVIKSLSYNVGPGCQREVNITRHLNSNYASFGPLSVNTPPATDNDGRANYDTETRLFALIEVCGKKNVQYYQFKKGATSGQDERLWSVARSGPALFSQSLEMRARVASVPRLIDADDDEGIVYRRNYLTLDDINDTSRKIYVDGSRIGASEQDASSQGDTTFIIPVNTPDGVQVPAGQPAIIPEED